MHECGPPANTAVPLLRFHDPNLSRPILAQGAENMAFHTSLNLQASPLYLCCGLQSSGTTLVSWCFLQRADMNGVLDAQYYLLPETFHMLPQLDSISNPLFNWYKATIACFRLTEYVGYFSDFGRVVVPFLVVKDVRNVWNSLRTKPYGRNGTVAEDPPLRLRFRRFLDDWEYCRRQGLPILRFESFVANPREQLASLCKLLGLPWDESMISWNKDPRTILDIRFGSPTFLRFKDRNLLATLKSNVKVSNLDGTSRGDLDWLENTFAEFNRICGYPPHVATQCRSGWDEPHFKHTRRYKVLRPWYHLKQLLRTPG